MDTSTLIYEAQLELESLDFLNIVGEPSKLSETRILANILTGKALTQTKQIFSIKSSGNYGIALYSVCMNKSVTNQGAVVTAAIMSYWALTNHVEQDNLPILVQNRGALMYSFRDLFYKIYQKSIAGKYSPYSIDFSVLMSSTEDTINRLIAYDFHTIRGFLRWSS